MPGARRAPDSSPCDRPDADRFDDGVAQPLQVDFWVTRQVGGGICIRTRRSPRPTVDRGWLRPRGCARTRCRSRLPLAPVDPEAHGARLERRKLCGELHCPGTFLRGIARDAKEHEVVVSRSRTLRRRVASPLGRIEIERVPNGDGFEAAVLELDAGLIVDRPHAASWVVGRKCRQGAASPARCQGSRGDGTPPRRCGFAEDVSRQRRRVGIDRERAQVLDDEEVGAGDVHSTRRDRACSPQRDRSQGMGAGCRRAQPSSNSPATRRTESRVPSGPIPHLRASTATPSAHQVDRKP